MVTKALLSVWSYDHPAHLKDSHLGHNSHVVNTAPGIHTLAVSHMWSTLSPAPHPLVSHVVCTLDWFYQ